MDNTTDNKNYERLMNSKIWALRIPWIMSIICLVAIIIITIQVLSTDISLKVTYSLGVTVGLTLIGIAFTVWVGLNIYNILERTQLDILDSKVERLTKLIGEQVKELDDQLALTIEFTNSISLNGVRQSKLMMINNKIYMENGELDKEGFNAYKQSYEAEKDRFLINRKLKTKYFIDHSLLMGSPMQLMQLVNTDKVSESIIGITTDFIASSLMEISDIYSNDMKETTFSDTDLEQEKDNITNNLKHMTTLGLPWVTPPEGDAPIPPEEPTSEDWYLKIKKSVMYFEEALNLSKKLLPKEFIQEKESSD